MKYSLSTFILALVGGFVGFHLGNLSTVTAANFQPILVGGSGTPPNSIQFPENATRAYIKALSGALTLSAGGSNQSINLLPTGTGIVNFGGGAAADITAALDSAAAKNRALQYRTAGSVRWSLFADNTAEAGANVGSDLRLNVFDDTGAFLSRAIFIKRSTGKIGLGVSAPTNPASEVDVTGDVNVSGVFRKGGTAGISPTITYLKSAGVSCTMNFSGGIITVTGGVGCP